MQILSVLQSCEFEHTEHKLSWGEHAEGPGNTIAASQICDWFPQVKFALKI